MLRIGLTGGIGSGKTTVAKLFEILGIPVFYADLEAHRIRSRADVSEQIVQHLGSTILIENRIDKRKLADVIFNDAEALRWLNNLLHPLVEKAFNGWCGIQSQRQIPFVLMESALIFEANFERLFDQVIVVDAPQELRVSRVMKRENISKNEVLQRIHTQLSADIKRDKADMVIINDEQHSLIEQVGDVSTTLDMTV
ncbi:MAG: dephospho-CoA kinase [Bacteroidales bacterium]|jgi:dephospho-CoA kinase|nr:dephospho-CoA kinase [Bacteroidales bacterium]